ncbi:MAG: copper chaperone PCu(A)C [Betaproteobacteria bacterium]|jgi:copper(I)-binding protein|nr:copper chaperone PCu(A)C [Betaproteobacteria bacterium]
MQIQSLKFTLAAGLVAALIGTALPVLAQSGVEVSNAWTRSTVAAQKTGGIYFDIRSTAPAKLVGVASPAAARVELHNMKMEGGVMKMSAVESIELAAGQTVKLAPGGYHVMLIDLKQPLKVGDSVPVTLTVERADKTRATIETKAAVRDMATAMQGGHDMHKGH